MTAAGGITCSGGAAVGAVAVVLATGFALLVATLARFWGANPDHADRLLILLASGWVAWQARPGLRTCPPQPIRLGWLPLVAGCLAFPVGWYLVAQVGPKPVVLWWLATAWLATTAGAVLLLAGPEHLRRLAFPLGFVWFALPVPNRILVPLQYGLQTATTATAAAVLPRLGVPVETHGFVLSLPGGDLGVAEACSGVRSVTALVAIAAFVAWWSGFGPVRGSLLVVLAVPVIAAVNAVRVIVSGLLHEYGDPELVRGVWHEALGVGMIGLGLGAIVGLARLLSPRTDEPARAARADGAGHAEPPGTRRKAGRAWGLAAVLLAAAGATAAAHLLGERTEQEIIATAPLADIPLRLGRWAGTDLPVPDDVAAMLTFDTAVQRVYRDLGYEVTVWAVFWSSRNMVKGYHHPDVCWPNRGFRMVSREVVPLPVGGGTLPVTVREFERGPDRHLILYWTQEGRRVWSAEDERQVRLAGDSHDWLGERLFHRPLPEPTGRLMVLLATPLWGNATVIRGPTLDLARRFADELYRVCPWAAPPAGSPP